VLRQGARLSSTPLWKACPLDLSFAHADAHPVTALPVALAVLMVGVAGRQAASTTARVALTLDRTGARADLLAPANGAFCGATAAALRRWKGR
jgi:hypothetical protein